MIRSSTADGKCGANSAAVANIALARMGGLVVYWVVADPFVQGNVNLAPAVLPGSPMQTISFVLPGVTEVPFVGIRSIAIVYWRRGAGRHARHHRRRAAQACARGPRQRPAPEHRLGRSAGPRPSRGSRRSCTRRGHTRRQSGRSSDVESGTGDSARVVTVRKKGPRDR